FLRKGSSTSLSGLSSSAFSAGMHSSCTHCRTFSRIALASGGISKSIAMTFPRLRLLVVVEWHIAARRYRQRQTMFEVARAPDAAQRVTLREAVRCRAGAVPSAGVWYGPGSAERHEECRPASGIRSSAIPQPRRYPIDGELDAAQ